jgi:hypothetical protein
MLDGGSAIPSNGYLVITSSTGSLIISLSADFTQADVQDNQTYPAITFSLPQGVRSMAADSGYDDHKLYDFRGFKLVCPVSEIYNHISSDSFRGLVWQLHEFRITRINQSLRLKYLVVSTLEVNGISTFPS